MRYSRIVIENVLALREVIHPPYILHYICTSSYLLPGTSRCFLLFNHTSNLILTPLSSYDYHSYFRLVKAHLAVEGDLQLLISLTVF